MSEDLRDCAKSILSCITKSESKTGSLYTFEETAGVCHGLMEPYELATAYLREHPADDDEPVTREWLEEIGFKRGSRLAFGRLQFTHYEGWNSWYSFSDGRGATRLINDVKTRGEVRQLMKSLKITKD